MYANRGANKYQKTKNPTQKPNTYNWVWFGFSYFLVWLGFGSAFFGIWAGFFSLLSLDANSNTFIRCIKSQRNIVKSCWLRVQLLQCSINDGISVTVLNLLFFLLHTHLHMAIVWKGYFYTEKRLQIIPLHHNHTIVLCCVDQVT